MLSCPGQYIPDCTGSFMILIWGLYQGTSSLVARLPADSEPQWLKSMLFLHPFGTTEVVALIRGHELTWRRRGVSQKPDLHLSYS
jgi:hypothetical protein